MIGDKKKMIQVDDVTHRMIKELAASEGMTMMAYLMKMAYEAKASNGKR